ncbi:hypothetical protein A2U01_0003272 [Trifolium medium]|uniref:Uncharacterized protein n=1 Tax=Trifolium medium TaxID=97028 RepID=A0A392M555_9FABA|nr:hypothetical protein [Trifolium medium]
MVVVDVGTMAVDRDRDVGTMAVDRERRRHNSKSTTRLTMVREREMPTLLQICGEANRDGGGVDGQ